MCLEFLVKNFLVPRISSKKTSVCLEFLVKNFPVPRVASKKLRSAKVPIANAKCAEFDIDEKLQICAGGDDGKIYYTARKNFLYNFLIETFGTLLLSFSVER